MQTHHSHAELVPPGDRGAWRFAHPSTIWAQVIAGGSQATLCAACGSHEQVAPDPRCGGIPFCAECIEHTHDLTEWDDIGRVD